MTIADKSLSIEVFLVDGDPEGMLTARIPFQWTGHILVFKRTQIQRALAREEAEQPGFYLIFGEDGKGKMFYTCKSIEFIEEEQNKNWWSTAIFVTNTGYLLTKAHINYLQEQIIKKAIKANRIILLNNTKVGSQAENDQSTTLSEGSTVYMEDFLKKIHLILSVLNFKIF